MSHYLLVVLLLVIGPCLATPMADLPRADLPYIQGFDLSMRQFKEDISEQGFWNCTYKSGFRKVVIRGYREACGHEGGGGHVNESFYETYQRALVAGYAWQQIDSYMFPCTNTPNPSITNPPCRTVAAQLKDFTDYLNKYKIQVHRLWLNIEQNEKECLSWNLGSTVKNRQLANEWIEAISEDSRRNPERRWGVYAPNSAKKWAQLFGDDSTPLAPHLPFWAVDVARNPEASLSKLSEPVVGGFKYPIAKQWKIDIPANISGNHCNGNVDFDSFDPAYQPVVSSPGSGLGGPTACKTTTDGLRYRTCAHTSQNCVAMGQYPLGTSVDFICQTPGDLINGINSWGRTKNGYYVSLAYVDQSCAQKIPACPKP